MENETNETNETKTAKKVQLQRKIHSELVRLYFSRVELTDVAEPGLRGQTFEYNSTLLETVMGMPGVEAATVYPYHMVVQKAVAFEWDEIEPGVLRLLTSLHLGLPSPEFLNSEDLPESSHEGKIQKISLSKTGGIEYV